MALLYYQNLGLDVHRPDILMSMTVSGLSDFYQYLERFKKYLESDAAVLRVAWEECSPPCVATWKNGGNKAGDSGYWVKLDFAESEDVEVAQQTFFDDDLNELFQVGASTEVPLDKTDGIKILRKDKENARLCLARKPEQQYLLPKGEEEGHWVTLTEPEDRPDLPDKVFQAFLDDSTNSIYQADPIESDETETTEDQIEAIKFTAAKTKDAKHCWHFPKKDEIRVLGQDVEGNRLLLSSIPDKAWLLLRPNTYSIEKQLEAIRSLQNAPQPEHRRLLKLFESSDYANWNYFSPKNIVETDWKLLTDEQRPGTTNQREFVKKALATPDFAFLEGPPGSGKTTAICELILQLIAQEKRVLLCASTHVAVDNVLERLKAEDNPHSSQVLPVRIGDKSNLSDTVKPYQFENLRHTEKQRLIKFLTGEKARSSAQQHLLDALQARDESVIMRIILDSANLVCGTTIGILQHPDIKGKKQADPVFDVLIIDESSKTLFPEFLVPALWAKRWILVGDPKQLSPYVDDEAMAKNVEAALPDATWWDVCLDVFQTSKHWKQGALLVSSQKETVLNAYKQQAKAHQDKILFADTRSDAMTLSCASIIVDTPANLEVCQTQLPLDIVQMRGETSELHIVQRRVAAWQERSGLKEQEEKTWGGEVAWRLARQYENRLSENSKQSDRLKSDIQDLLPANEQKMQVERDIDRICRVALPSVLESLQKGFERRQGQKQGTKEQKRGTTLTDGLPEDALAQRHVLLEYQHRMHPDISRYSREHIYEGEALNDPADMQARRAWTYSRHSKRAIWLDVPARKSRNKGNSNQAEADVVIQEIKRFSDWAKNNPTPEGKAWRVAVLSFYRGQEKLLRERLRKLSRQFRGFRHFYLNGDKQKHSVHVEVCTVDRFQGQEADLVLLSFVKDHPTVFLGSPNRLNVAVTRARFQLLLIGNRQKLNKDQYPELKALVESVPHTPTWNEEKEHGN